MSESLHKPTLLLAAESGQVSRLIAKQLQDYFHLVSAQDAESCWELLVDNRDIALLICDLGLSIDAFGLLERIRQAQDSRLAATPVLLLIGETDPDDQREIAFKCGATDFINLPFASSELKARVRLHANLYVQHAADPTLEMQQVTAVNLLQQLSQENFFNSRVQQEISFSQRHRSSFSLCKLKLDNIKAIVAGFDRQTAMSLVKAVARIVQQTLRREDCLCYLGNAEFCILFPATNAIGATSGVNRIIANVTGRRIKIAGKPVPATLSGAIYSCIAGDDTRLEKIHGILDDGISSAIEAGGNRVVTSGMTGEERTLSVDRALTLIETGDTGDLARHAASLLQRIRPLIRFAADQLGPEIGENCREFDRRLQTDDH